MLRGDQVNAVFEVAGAVATWSNVRRLISDRVAHGIDWRSFIFYSAWGAWNLYYYPSLDQPWSFVAGIALASGNVTWVLLYLYFRRDR
jgi:hypothetical protein